jgi:hypothetical protein
MDSAARHPPFLPLDTTPEAQAVQDAAYRGMTGRERSAVAFRLSQLARDTAAAGIRSRHPQYTADEAHRALFRLMFGDALAQQVWPALPLMAP